MSSGNTAEAPFYDLDDLRAAFVEVLGYVKAYRSGADAGPELGWAIRNFNEILEGLREADSRESGQ